MRRFVALWGLVFALAAASPVLADDGIQVGATYRDVLQLKTYGSPQVPLPPGEWKLVSLGETRSNDSYNIRLLAGYLIQTKGNSFAGRVFFKVPDSPARGAWNTPAFCTRKNLLANYTTSNGAYGSFDCLYVLGSGMGRPSNGLKELDAFYDYIDQNKIKKATTALYIGYALSDERTYLLVDYLFNPELDGVPAASVAAWHIDQYKAEPKRMAYVEKMKAWAQEWRPKVLDGYKGRLAK